MAEAESKVWSAAQADGQDPDAAVKAACLRGPMSGQVGDVVKQKATSIEDLYARVRASKDLVIQDVLNELIRYGLKSDEPARKFLGPGVKGVVRAMEKINNDYKGDFTKLKDALRFTVYVPSMADFRVVCRGTEELEAEGVIKVLLKKNRFIGKPAPGGYRDGNFVFELCWTETLCECQILLQKFADIKEEAHESYEVCRSLHLVGNLPLNDANVASDEKQGGQDGVRHKCLKGLAYAGIGMSFCGWAYVSILIMAQSDAAESDDADQQNSGYGGST